MSVFNHVGSPDTDLLILLYLNDSHLFNLFQVSKEINEFLNNELLWRTKVKREFAREYEQNLKEMNICLWKDYYKSIVQPLRSKFPFFEAAIALHHGRNDIVSLIQEKLQIDSTPIISFTISKGRIEQTICMRADGSEIIEGYNNIIVDGKGTIESIYKSGYLESSRIIRR